MVTLFVFSFALGCVLVSVILIFFSGWMVFELDYTDEQRKATDTQATLISLFGLISLCGSFYLAAISKRIASFLFKFLGVKLSKYQ